MKHSVAMIFCASALLGSDLDHSDWNQIAKKYINTEHRVDYARLKQESSTQLDRYVTMLALPWPTDLGENPRKAALINAYNALTVRWILTNYPVASIWKTSKPFSQPRHRVNGRNVSLDQLEKELRDGGDPRIHAALVCAARSCPPLRREAFGAATLDAQLDDNTREWLRISNLNSFDAASNKADVSSIFKWYKSDFELKGSTLGAFLSRYGPAGNFTKITFKDYDWGLNDSTDTGRKYSSISLYWDYLKNKLP